MTEPRPASRWDIAVSVSVMAIAVVVVAALTLSAVFLVFAADPCGSERCNDIQLTAGWLAAMAVPGAVLLAACIVAIVRMVRGRASFWIPIVGLLLAIGGWLIGVVLVFGAVPGFHP